MMNNSSVNAKGKNRIPNGAITKLVQGYRQASQLSFIYIYIYIAIEY